MIWDGMVWMVRDGWVGVRCIVGQYVGQYGVGARSKPKLRCMLKLPTRIGSAKYNENVIPGTTRVTMILLIFTATIYIRCNSTSSGNAECCARLL